MNKSFKFTTATRLCNKGFVRVEVRYDNIDGRNTKRSLGVITIGSMWSTPGQNNILDEVFPELSRLSKFHLFDENGPVHYLANTIFLAGDRDCWGTRAGEQKRDKNGVPMWKPERYDQPSVICSHEKPDPLVIKYVPMLGEGKKRELDAARRVACWPEATDEELSVESDVLKAALLARLPKLVVDFHAALDEAYQWWESTGSHEKSVF